MRRLLRLSALVLSGMLANTAVAQPPALGVGPHTPQARAVRRDAPPRSDSYRRRPASAYYDRNEDARRGGFRNPGGVGRYAEYYPPGNQFQNEQGRNPSYVATFNGGSGVPTVDEQMAAQQLGVQKYNAIQQSIDRYARPYFGYGYGAGFYGGFY